MGLVQPVSGCPQPLRSRGSTSPYPRWPLGALILGPRLPTVWGLFLRWGQAHWIQPPGAPRAGVGGAWKSPHPTTAREWVTVGFLPHPHIWPSNWAAYLPPVFHPHSLQPPPPPCSPSPPSLDPDPDSSREGCSQPASSNSEDRRAMAARILQAAWRGHSHRVRMASCQALLTPGGCLPGARMERQCPWRSVPWGGGGQCPDARRGQCFTGRGRWGPQQGSPGGDTGVPTAASGWKPPGSTTQGGTHGHNLEHP